MKTSRQMGSAVSAALERNVDEALDRALREQRIVGAVVVVLHDGTILYRKATGLADREAKQPVRVDTVFRLASSTKPIVAIAVLRLVDQGVLQMDAPVTRWLPDFRPQLADGSVPVITIEQLLMHTSGLGCGFFEPADGPYHKLGVSDGMDEPGITLDENLRRLACAPLLHAPGSAWQYSLSFEVLGRVMEKATQRALPDVVRELVTEPLKMTDTAFVAAQPERLATPYADGDPAPVRMTALCKNPIGGGSTVDLAPGRALDARAYSSGGSGMVGTAEDYARLLELIRAGDPSLLATTTHARLGANATGALPILTGPGWGWGLVSSVVVDPALVKTPQSIGTMEWRGAYGHNCWIDPRAGLTVVMLTNTSFEGMSGKLPADIKCAVYRALE